MLKMDTQKKEERGQNLDILTKKARSIKDLLNEKRTLFSCGHTG